MSYVGTKGTRLFATKMEIRWSRRAWGRRHGIGRYGGPQVRSDQRISIFGRKQAVPLVPT